MQVPTRRALAALTALTAGGALVVFWPRSAQEPVASERQVAAEDLMEGADVDPFRAEDLDFAGIPEGGFPLDPDWVDPATLPPEDVELTELRDDPGPWFGRRVRFHLQYAGARAEWEPFLTRFGPADFVAFDAWGDREYPWDADVFENPAGTMFARRGSVVEASLALARQHQRFLAVGIVRDVFLGEPWIEVQSIVRQPEHVPEGTLLHVQQARGFRELEQWDMALDQLRRAMAAPLPAHATAALEELVVEVEEARAEVERSRRARR